MTEILVIRPQSNQLGDTICTLPMYKALKDRYPDSAITLVGCPTNYDVELKKLNPFLDDLIIYSKKSLKVLFDFIRALRRKKYDVVLVPSSIRMSYTSYVIAFLAKGKLKAGVGRMDGEKNRLKFILDVKPEYDWKRNKTHQAERFLDTARAAGCGLSTDEAKKMRMNFSPEDTAFADEFISSNFPGKNRKIAGFHPGAGQKINLWSASNYFELIKRVYGNFKPYLLITSGVIDKGTTEKLLSKLDEAGIEFKIMSGLSVIRAAAVISRLNVFVSNNTGIMHLASYCGTNTVGFFYKDDAYEWHQYFRDGVVLESPSKDINEITVEAAYESVSKFL